MAQGSPSVKKNKIDWIMLGIVAVLVAFGLVMVYSASSYEAQEEYGSALVFVRKQAIATAIGLGVFAAAAFIPYNFWRTKVSLVVYFLTLVITLMVLSPIGIESNGARRWIDLHFLTLQPAELLKVGLLLATSLMIVMNRNRLGTFVNFALTIAPTILAAGVVAVVTDDLGTAIIMFAMGIIMIALVAPKKKYIVLLVAGVIAIGVVFILVKPYRMTRIKAWLNLEAYADEESYQPLQALYAIASGGLFGKGLGKSTQKLGFIPESENDMIFSIVCEELGVIGGLCLIGLILMLLFRMYKLYRNTDDMFGKLIIAGIMGHIGVQTFVNVGVVSSLLPNTGVPLPFISYGGSSIMVLLLEMGLIVSISRGAVTRKVRKKETEGPVLREDKSKGVIYYQ